LCRVNKFNTLLYGSIKSKTVVDQRDIVIDCFGNTTN
jgi:hypothetical protein